MKQKSLKLGALIMALVFILSACSKKEEVQESQTALQETTSQETVAETVLETNSSPIETEPAEFDAYSKFSGQQISLADNNKRPFAVMLDNHPNARMQAGLREADIVFEMIVEGTYTRYMAIFHSQQPERVGPIRSARKYFVDRMLEYDSIYSHYGGSDEAENYIKDNGFERISGMIVGSNTIWRDGSTGKIAPHNAYASYDSLKSYADSVGYPEDNEEVQGFNFYKEAEVLGGQAANKVMVSYFLDNNSIFTFDQETKTYNYNKDGIDQTDENNQEPLMISNIIIQVTNYYPNADYAGILTMESLGQGQGYLVSMGEYLPITWEKADRNSQTKYYYEGEEILLNPGQTWILLASPSTAISFE